MNWIQILAQKYPGGTFYGRDWKKNPAYTFVKKHKLDYWGADNDAGWPSQFDPTNHALLTRIPPQDFNFLVRHLAEKYLDVISQSFESKSFFCRKSSKRKRSRYVESTYSSFPEEINSEPFYDDLSNSIDQLCHKSEIIDKELIDYVRSMAKKQTLYEADKLWKQKIKNSSFFVRVYGVNQAFGGNEEGGWWYDDKTMVHEEEIVGLQNACNKCSHLFSEYEKLSNPNAVNESMVDLDGGLSDLYEETSSNAKSGFGDLSYNDLDSEGMNIPRGWTPSSFEYFFVQVEKNMDPIDETREVPHYE